MEDRLRERPFDNFKLAITDPAYFFGRSNLLDRLRLSPFEVRILLGGRRLGKTSTLRAIEWNLLDPNLKPRRAFPVFISMQVEQPEDLNHLRYLLIVRLRDALERWKKTPGDTIRKMYHRFLHQVAGVEVSLNFIAQINLKVNFNNSNQRLNHDGFQQGLLDTLDELKKWQFEGVCFLLDETEYIVRKEWANDAWSYFRGLKDTDTALKSSLGFVLAGYRDLKNYPQKVGSSLFNIADIKWLTTLTEQETRALIYSRATEEGFSVPEKVVTSISNWGGRHPYLTQQMLNTIFDDGLVNRYRSTNSLIDSLLHQHNHDFSTWWNANNRNDGFGDAERAVYRALMAGQTHTEESLARFVGLPLVATKEALDVLEGTGVIHRQKEDDHHTIAIGAQLFEKWVSQHSAT